MNTLTFNRSLLDSVAPNQEKLAFADRFVTDLFASQSCAAQGAKPSDPFIQVSQASLERASANLAQSIFGSMALPIGSDNEWLTVCKPLGPGCVAALARGDQVLRDVVESIAIQVVNDKIDASGPLPILPLDVLATPVTGMPAWPDVIKEDLAMLFDSSERPCQRVSVLAVQDSILDPVALVDLHAFLSSHSKYTTMGA